MRKQICTLSLFCGVPALLWWSWQFRLIDWVGCKLFLQSGCLTVPFPVWLLFDLLGPIIYLCAGIGVLYGWWRGASWLCEKLRSRP